MSTRRRPLLLPTTGLVVGILGVVGYFVVVFWFGAWFPSVRNDAVPNWLLVALGLVLSTLAVVRAERRTVPGILLGVNGLVAAAFAGILYVVPIVPGVAGPAVGAPAPPFALVDQGGKTVRLEDFRGGPLLLVFYRGHW